MNEQITVAIVGCGVIGTVHADVVNEHPGLTVTALVDPVRENAERLADRIATEHGAARPAVFGSLEEAAAGAEFELVAVCTPSGLHVEVAQRVLELGRHLVVEKPLDVAVGRGKALLQKAREARERGILTSVISQHRFDPESIATHEAIVAGRLGRLTSAVASVAWWRSQAYYDSGAWRGTWAMDGGGALMNQGVHTVDLLLWMMGRPVEISAMTGLIAHERVEVEDTAVAIIRFESGALATLHATTAAYPSLTNRLQVHGDRGSAVIDVDRLAYFYAAVDDDPEASFMGLPYQENNRADEELAPELQTTVMETGLVPGHLRQYSDIHDAIRGAGKPGVGVEDALLALATVRSVYLSATLGHPVLLDEVIDGKYDDIVVTTGAQK
jgi:predicted dehydrogenase